MALKPIPLTADPDNPESPKGAVPVDLFGVESGGGGAVDSVNGQTGEVVLGAGDVGARPAGDVPWGEVSDKPATYPPAPHTHAIGEVTGLQSALDGKQPEGDYLTEDDLPDLSGYVETSDPRLTDARTPLAHTHPISDVTGLQDALDDLDDAIGDVGAVLDSILEGTP